MRISRQQDHLQALELTPLIDCVFLMLIFFLVATTFKRQESETIIQKLLSQQAYELAVNLPDPAIAAGPADVEIPLVISVREDGTFILAGKNYSRWQLQQSLEKLSQSNPPRIRIDVDRDARSVHLVELLDLLSYYEFAHYTLRTATPPADVYR